MNASQTLVYLFEYGGGIVVGTDNIALARSQMRKRIREEYESFAPLPWQVYDFTWREPAVERGHIVEDPRDLTFAEWVAARDGVVAVRWRN